MVLLVEAYYAYSQTFLVSITTVRNSHNRKHIVCNQLLSALFTTPIVRGLRSAWGPSLFSHLQFIYRRIEHASTHTQETYCPSGRTMSSTTRGATGKVERQPRSNIVKIHHDYCFFSILSTKQFDLTKAIRIVRRLIFSSPQKFKRELKNSLPGKFTDSLLTISIPKYCPQTNSLTKTF